MTIEIAISNKLVTVCFNSRDIAIITDLEEEGRIRELASELKEIVEKHIQNHED